MKFCYVINWKLRNGETCQIEASAGFAHFNEGFEAVRSKVRNEAILAAIAAGWSQPKWWQWWRWGDERLPTEDIEEALKSQPVEGRAAE